MADGRFDGERIVTAARELSQNVVLFDANDVARTSGTPVNAILFGALIASRALPFDRAAAETAIRQAGKAAESNLRGFALGFEQAARAIDATATASAKPPTAKRPLTVDDFPSSVQETIGHGVERLTDYQGRHYAQLFLDRLKPVLALEQGAGGKDFVLTRETARYLALWMSYEDVIRVADLKTRAGRRERIRKEVRAKGADIVRVADFLKPGLEELCSILPAGLGQSLYAFASKRGWAHRFNVGMHIRSTNVGGFILLRLLASLRWWRPHSWRYRDEQARIQKWLAAISQAAAHNIPLAAEIAGCGQIMKGYGDTHARAIRNFDLISEAYFHATTEPAALAIAIAAARKAALTDPEGQTLATEIAKSSRISTTQQRPFAAAAE